MIEFGIFSYVPGARDSAEAGAKIRAWGLDAVKIHRQRPDDCLDTPLTAQRCRAIRRGYETSGVRVVAFAAYRDLATTDAERRAEARRQMIEWIRWAPELGAPLVCSEATVDAGRGSVRMGGTDSAESRAREGQFRILVDEVGALDPYARAAGVTLALEPSAPTPLNDVESALTLMRTIDSPHVKIIFDPANLMTVDRLGDQREFSASALDALAPHVALVHAKDFTHADGLYQTPAAGTGLLDWTAIFERLDSVGYDGPVILEHLTAEQVPMSRDYLLGCLDRARTNRTESSTRGES